MAAQVEWFSSLDEAERDAQGALARAARPSLFERLDWFRLVEAHMPPDGALLAMRARNGVASAWLMLARSGASASAFVNCYSLQFGPIVSGERSEEALDALVAGLRKAGLHRLTLAPLAADDPLPAALRRRGWIVRIGQTSVNWRVRTAGKSFEDYWAARPSKLRNTARRRAKAAGLELRVHRSFDAAAWADYETVYANSWKPEEGSPALMRRLAETEGAAGALRLGLAYHEGQPVAAQLWIVEGGIATIHKLAYREDARHLSPGTVLSVEMFRQAIDEDEVMLIDFGTGNDGYKADWMEEAVPLYALTAYDPLSLDGLLALARDGARKLVRRGRSD